MWIKKTAFGEKKLREEDVALLKVASLAMEGPEKKGFMFDPVISIWFLFGLFTGIVIGLIF